MKLKKRIYCIEGVHDWGDGEVEPTVEPILNQLQETGAFEYLRRTSATAAELKYRLGEEWLGYCAKGSVLYFATHGGPDQVWLSEKEVVGLLTLKEWLDCKGCHIHFGGCCTFGKRNHNLQDLMECTAATSVSGYATESGWLGRDAPAQALELHLFALLAEANIASAKGRKKRLENTKSEINHRFRDCKFRMLVS